jgi:hypothetical protein
VGCIDGLATFTTHDFYRIYHYRSLAGKREKPIILDKQEHPISAHGNIHLNTNRHHRLLFSQSTPSSNGKGYKNPKQMQTLSHSHHRQKQCRKNDDSKESLQLYRWADDIQSFRGKGMCHVSSIPVDFWQSNYLQTDTSIVDPSNEVRVNDGFEGEVSHSVHGLHIQRGEHNIDNQLIFKSNPEFIFHDSRGFEAGTVNELELVKEFIRDRADTRELPDQLHAIWYCN